MTVRNHSGFLLVLVLVCPSDGRAQDRQPAPKDGEPRFVKLNDLRVHYQSHGVGKSALVLVHGWSCDLHVWRFQVPAFAGKGRVILLDLPGHGKSDRPEIDYTMDLFARAVDAVLQDAGVEEAVLAGHSMGTPVVRQFYRLFPRKTKALVAVDGSLRPWNMDPAQKDKFFKQLDGPDFKEVAAKFMEGMLTPRTPAEVRTQLRETVGRASRHVAVSAMKAMGDPAIWKEDKIEVPLLIVNAQSPFWTGDYEAHVRKLAPGVDYQILDGVGHFLMMEKPKEFNEIVIRFVGKQGVWQP